MNTSASYAAVLALFLASHKDEHQQHGMVYEVWEDGEITLTKGGELYGQRTLHTIAFGSKKSLQLADIPEKLFNKHNDHARVMVKDHDTAVLVSNAIHYMEF